MLAGANFTQQQDEGPDLGMLVKRALAMMPAPQPVAPLQPMQMPVPPAMRARLMQALQG